MDTEERGGRVYLTGSYQHNLDAKQRLTLPASFRKQFDGVVHLVPVNGAIYGFTPEAHAEWVMSFFENGFDARNRKHDALKRKLNARTVIVEVDNAGRIALGKLPAAKLEQYGISRAVTVIGNGDHFEVWNAATVDDDADDDAELDALMFDSAE